MGDSSIAFRDRPWTHRMTDLGDQAEGVFEKVYPQGWARYGLNRPPLNMAMVPEIIRYTPDYVTSKGLVEVQGFGRDQTCKLKHSKWAALLQWHDTMFRTDLFVYDSKNKRYGFIRIAELHDLLERGGIPSLQFPEGNGYWAIPAEQLPVVEWLQVDTPDEAT